MDIAVRKSGQLTEFDPERHRLRVAAIDYSIEEAKRIKNWPALEEAVDTKIEEQRKFVIWWKAAVRDRGRPKKDFSPEIILSADQAEIETGIGPVQVARLGKKLETGDSYRAQLLGAGYRAAMLEAAENHRAEGTGENEWYTPERYIALARKVLGEIDLDPASSAKAQLTVGAAQYFSTEQNGLNQEWYGRVWLNPPYAQPLIGNFVEKLVEERSADRVSAAIMLTHNYTDTAWFHKGCEVADAVCFTRGRIKFVDAQGNDCAPTQGQALFYFGDDVARFASVFIDVGFVVTPAR